MIPGKFQNTNHNFSDITGEGGNMEDWKEAAQLLITILSLIGAIAISWVQIRSSKRQREDYKSALESKDNEIRAVEAALKSKDEIVRAKEAQIDVLRTTIDQLNSLSDPEIIKIYKARVTVLKGRIKELEEDLESLNQEKARLDEEKAKSDSKKVQLSVRLEEVETQSREKRVEVELAKQVAANLEDFSGLYEPFLVCRSIFQHLDRSEIEKLDEEFRQDFEEKTLREALAWAKREERRKRLENYEKEIKGNLRRGRQAILEAARPVSEHRIVQGTKRDEE